MDDVNLTPHVLHSPVRACSSIPGILILEGNKTYGRERRPKASLGRLLYKCVPDDKRLPAFVVPYELKHIGFSKVFTNLYVTMRFDQWVDKHPRGKLEQVIGPIDVLDHFYEYQLYCKSLHASIQPFQKAATHSLQGITQDSLLDAILAKVPAIEDRTHQRVFTIDPHGSADLDDGVSICTEGDTTVISVYIADVALWLDHLGLWDAFSNRVATIYLPDKKRPMLPTILSDGLCSLHQGVRRLAFVMDLRIRDHTMVDISFGNAVIQVDTNFAYEEDRLLCDSSYLHLCSVVKALYARYPFGDPIYDSHDVVSYLMITMNYHCAKTFQAQQCGIFRTTIMSHTPVDLPHSVPDEVRRFVTMWATTSGRYVTRDHILLDHSVLNLDAYTHITSPIRRLVDLLNLICKNRPLLSESAGRFFDKWVADLDIINTAMRSIRKIQCDSQLLDRCQRDPSVLNSVYDGYLFDKWARDDGLYQYTVYLPALKLSSRIIQRRPLDTYVATPCRLYWFTNEDTFKRKIRVQVLDEVA
ncbi:MAG: RNB domain-containing ribonuclease [Flavobacterium sp.]